MDAGFCIFLGAIAVYVYSLIGSLNKIPVSSFYEKGYGAVNYL